MEHQRRQINSPEHRWAFNMTSWLVNNSWDLKPLNRQDDEGSERRGHEDDSQEEGKNERE